MRRLSIIIPAYNEESNLPILRERLTALFDSAPEYEFELIVVDDHSADATFDLLKAWTEADPQDCVIRLSRNFGSHAAFHAGLAECTGDAATFLAARTCQTSAHARTNGPVEHFVLELE